MLDLSRLEEIREVQILKSRWLRHKDVLINLTIEVHRVDIHLMNSPPCVSCNCQDYSYEDHLGNEGEGFTIVKTFALHKALGNKAGFVFVNSPVAVVFNFKHPLATN